MSNKVLRNMGNGRLSFYCEGCGMPHSIMIGEGSGRRWAWNGSMKTPTFTPSIHVRWFEPSDNDGEFDDPSKDVKKVCHSFITGGVIKYLDDCTHHLAGQSAPLHPVEGCNADD